MKLIYLNLNVIYAILLVQIVADLGQFDPKIILKTDISSSLSLIYQQVLLSSV